MNFPLKIHADYSNHLLSFYIFGKKFPGLFALSPSLGLRCGWLNGRSLDPNSCFSWTQWWHLLSFSPSGILFDHYNLSKVIEIAFPVSSDSFLGICRCILQRWRPQWLEKRKHHTCFLKGWKENTEQYWPVSLALIPSRIMEQYFMKVMSKHNTGWWSETATMASPRADCSWLV